MAEDEPSAISLSFSLLPSLFHRKVRSSIALSSMPATTMSSRRGLAASAAVATVALAGQVARAQQYVNGTYYPGTDWTNTYDPSIVPSPNSTETVHTRMLTPDGFWHNRYQ